MRLFKKILLVLVIILVILQFLPRTINQDPKILSTDLTSIYPVTAEVRSLLQAACYDCHSNNTRYPWYAQIQPFRLLLDKHVKEGKEELNFSEYGNYSRRQQRNKLKLVEESLKKGTMPLKSYILMHPEARLTTEQKKVIYKWVNETRNLKIED
jgi:hypothetical protein